MHGYIKNNVYYKVEAERNKLHMSGGCWTVNMNEISGHNIERLEYVTEKHIYSISYHNAVKKGFVRLLGGELKLIVPINCWRIRK